MTAAPRQMRVEELLALPVTVDLETAGRAWGMGRTKSYELALRGEFPCAVLRLGRRYRVTRAGLLAALGIPDGDAAQPVAAGGSAGGQGEAGTGQESGGGSRSPSPHKEPEDVMTARQPKAAVTETRPLMLKIPDAARELQIGLSKMYELLRTGEIRSVKLGPNATRIPFSELTAYLERKKAEDAAPGRAEPAPESCP